MRKLKAFFCSAAAVMASAVALTGCTGSAIVVSLDNPYPWSGSGYEKATYSVTIYNHNEKGEKKDIFATGEYVTEIIDNAETSASNIKYGRVNNSLTLHYNENADEVDRGKTDTINAYAIYNMNGMVTRESYREYNVEKRDGATELFSYVCEMNYFAGRGTFKTYKSEDDTVKEEVSELSFTSDTYYDNEQLYYLARAQALGAGASQNFFLTSPLNSFSANKITTYTMSSITASSLENRKSGLSVYPYVLPEEPDEAVGADETPCYAVTLSIGNSTTSGPPTFMYFSTYDATIDGKTNKKVLEYFYTQSFNGTVVATETQFQLKDIIFTQAEA